MKNPLCIPLCQDQITAGKEIRLKLRYWQQADAALLRMKQALPGFDVETALLKVAAINTLYGTNLYAFARMAEHIASTMRGKPPLEPALVECLACVPAVRGQRAWRHFSFASKFCHFFVDENTFPIYDTWAHQTLARHLGRRRNRDSNRPYAAFVENLKQLIGAANLNASPSDLDSYLWIRGGFEVWRQRPATPMNTNLRAFFEANERSRLLKRLLADE